MPDELKNKVRSKSEVGCLFQADLMVDDKLRILAAMKRSWQDQLTTIFPRQGHYACDPKIVAAYPAPDITVERIVALVDYDLQALIAGHIRES